MSKCLIIPRALALNLLARGTTTLQTGTADSLYPLTQAYNGRPSQPVKMSAAGAVTFQVDGDLLLGYGSMEGTYSGGVAPGWTDGSTGGGVPAEEGAITHGGSKAQKLTASTGSKVARIYRDFLVQAGGTLSVEAYLRGDGTATMYARAMDLTTGYWWDGAAWQTSVSSWGSRTSGASYAASTTTITTQAASVLLAGTSRIRLSFVVDGSVATGSGYVDDVAAWPSVDFVSVHGHNLQIGTGVDLISSTTSGFGSPTTEASITTYQPSFFKRLASPVARRYWRLAFYDFVAVGDPFYFGEIVLGRAVELARSPDYPIGLRHAYAHRRTSTWLGHPWVAAVNSRPARVLDLAWTGCSASEYRELRDQLYLCAGGDEQPVVIVPLDDDPECVIYGRLQGDFEPQQTLLSYRTLRATVAEHPFPVSSL